jgi:transcriptional antiterminator NusG
VSALTNSDSHGFAEGQEVEVVKGPFTGFAGSVTHVNPRTRRLTVLVTIHGRHTPVEFAFDEVRRL